MSQKKRRLWLSLQHVSDEQESEPTLADIEGQGNLECHSTWGCTVRCNLATEQQQVVEK